MDRYAILVDAGYFFAAGAQAIANKQTPRRDISIKSPSGLIDALAAEARLQTQVPNALRVYWYDALSGPRPSIDQAALAHLPGVKLRLGTLNTAGGQKGVDSLIVTDLIDLARNRAITDAIIVSGDEDLRIAFQIAQAYGVRAHVLAIGDHTKNVSPALQMEADSVVCLDAAWLNNHLSIAKPAARERPAPAAPASAPAGPTAPAKEGETDIDKVAVTVAVELFTPLSLAERTALQQHFLSNLTVPPEFDKRLIAITARIMARVLTGAEKRQARGVFVKHVRDWDGKSKAEAWRQV